jgi:hypothetical protein
MSTFPTSARRLTAALLLTLAYAPMARAADLYRDDPPPRAGAAYDDPRYADLYGEAPPRPRADVYRRYEPGPPLPHERVYRDDRDPRDRYDPRYAGDRYDRGCPSKDEISRQLGADGWGRFHNPQVIDRNRATIDAERPNGRPYRLEVDRCTGEVITLRPLDGPRDGPRYGYADPGYAPRYEPRRY